MLISYWNVQEYVPRNRAENEAGYLSSSFDLLTSFKIWPPSNVPKDAWSQGLNLYLLHLIISAQQFTTQIHCSSGLALAEAVNKTNPRNTACGWEFINALRWHPPCFLPSRLQLHLAAILSRCVVNFKDLSQTLTYMEEHGFSNFWTNSHRESEAFSIPRGGRRVPADSNCLCSEGKSEVSPLLFRA